MQTQLALNIPTTVCTDHRMQLLKSNTKQNIQKKKQDVYCILLHQNENIQVCFYFYVFTACKVNKTSYFKSTEVQCGGPCLPHVHVTAALEKQRAEDQCSSGPGQFTSEKMSRAGEIQQCFIEFQIHSQMNTEYASYFSANLILTRVTVKENTPGLRSCPNFPQ